MLGSTLSKEDGFAGSLGSQGHAEAVNDLESGAPETCVPRAQHASKFSVPVSGKSLLGRMRRHIIGAEPVIFGTDGERSIPTATRRRREWPLT